MTRKYYWGTVYLVRPGWKRDAEHDEDVVDAFDHKVSSFDQAVELWRLAGDDARAAKIEAILEQSYTNHNDALNDAQIDELIALLDGLYKALQGSVLDEHGNTPADRLPELRQRLKTINLGEESGHVLTAEIGCVAAGNVYGLRNILLEARERGLHVALE
jgi:hypothetical protein